MSFMFQWDIRGWLVDHPLEYTVAIRLTFGGRLITHELGMFAP
jgi:hypothetical protein